MQDNKVYHISNYGLQNANPQYNNLKNRYEIVITEDTKIKECQDRESTQSMRFARRSSDFNAPLLTFQEVTKARLGENSNSSDYFRIVATIDSINAYFYEACPKDSCRKKVS